MWLSLGRKNYKTPLKIQYKSSERNRSSKSYWARSASSTSKSTTNWFGSGRDSGRRASSTMAKAATRRRTAVWLLRRWSGRRARPRVLRGKKKEKRVKIGCFAAVRGRCAPFTERLSQFSSSRLIQLVFHTFYASTIPIPYTTKPISCDESVMYLVSKAIWLLKSKLETQKS